MSLQLPSVQELLQAISNAAKRFPLAFLFAIIGCVIATILVHDPGFSEITEQNFVKAFLTCLLALPLFISINSLELTTELRPGKKWLLRGLALLFLTAFYWFSPTQNMDSIKFITRFIGFNLVFHLLVAFLPFLKQRDDLRFWEYNKTLFLNIFQGLFYSATAGLGLMLALLALDKLFGINIEEEVPMTIWIWLIGVVNTVYFLSHFPNRKDVSESSIEMPKALFIFLKYVAIPLIVLYFIILYAYTGKITFQWEWPQGWISKLILGFSIAGILGFLLSYPKHKKNELLQEFTNLKSKSLAFFGKYYFGILLPMCVVLLLAIHKRISEYGVTELRFFGAALAVWLAVVTLYMIFSKKKHILFVPLSLSVFTILTILGPLNAYNVSAKNQLGRLMEALSKNNLLENGKIVPVKANISNEAVHSIRGAINYFFDSGQSERLTGLLPEDVNIFSEDKWAHKNELISYLNIPEPEIDYPAPLYKSFYTNFNSSIDISRYDRIQRFHIAPWFEYNEQHYNNSHEQAVFIDSTSMSFIIPISGDDQKDTKTSAELIVDLINKTTLNQSEPIDINSAVIEWEDEGLNYKLIFEHAGMQVNDFTSINANGWFLYETKQE